MEGVVDKCVSAYKGECKGCSYSHNPDLHDGGCEFIPATEKQMSYAEDIAEELGIDLPEELSISEVSQFISDNADDYYASRRERMGGYGEMYDRIDNRTL